MGPVAVEGRNEFLWGRSFPHPCPTSEADVQHFVGARQTEKKELGLSILPLRFALRSCVWFGRLANCVREKRVSVRHGGECEHFAHFLLLHGLPTHAYFERTGGPFHHLWGVPPTRARVFVGTQFFYHIV